MLLPLLDRLAPVTPGADVQPGGRVSLHVDGGQARLLIAAHADADRASLPQALIYHLQVALYALYGDTCHITTRPDARHGGADRALQIEWTLSPQHKVASLLEADSISTQTTGV